MDTHKKTKCTRPCVCSHVLPMCVSHVCSYVCSHVLPMCASHVCSPCVYHMSAPMCSPCVLRVRYPLQTKIRIVIVIGTIATIAWHPGRVGGYTRPLCAVCVVVLAVEAHSELLDPVCLTRACHMCIQCSLSTTDQDTDSDCLYRQ